MAATSARKEALPAASATEMVQSAGKTDGGAQSFEVTMGGTDGTSFSFSTQHCNCCPYGYHIDLDFLQFLDSLYDPEYLKTLKRFKRGTGALLSPTHSDCSDAFSPNHERSKETENLVLISDGDGISPREMIDTSIDVSICRHTATSSVHLVRHITQDQATEIERGRHLVTETTDSSLRANALEGCSVDSLNTEKASGACGGRPMMTKMEVKLCNVLPLDGNGGTQPSASGTSLMLDGVFDPEGGRVSPTVLQAIREQLVVSLRRMKELEDQVKVIPVLQSHISMLKEENSLLMLTNDRTYCDAAVGDLPAVDEVSEKLVPQSHGDETDTRTIETSELISSRVEDSSSSTDTNTTEVLTSVPSTSSLMSSAHSLNSNIKTVDAFVNTDDISAPDKECRSVGILSKFPTCDSCVGTNVEFAERGVGDDTVSLNGPLLDDPIERSQTIISSETASDSKCSEHVSSSADGADDQVLIENDPNDFDHCAPMSVDSDRFRSVAVQCDDIDGFDRTVSIGNGDFQNSRILPDGDRRSTNSRSTQTDDFLLSGFTCGGFETGDYENLAEIEKEIHEIAPQSSEGSKKRITFGTVTIYEAETPVNEVYVISSDDSIEEKSDQKIGAKEIIKDPSISSCSQTPSAEIRSEPLCESPVECIVIEQVLESARCGESVVIYDSNESSPASSDSEDSSALSVLEVVPGDAARSVSKAMKSVDEYFDGGGGVAVVSVQEDSSLSDASSRTEEQTSGEENILDVEVSTPKEGPEEFKVDGKSPDGHILFPDSDKLSEIADVSEGSLTSPTAVVCDESSENSRTDSDDLTDLSGDRIHDDSVDRATNGLAREVTEPDKDDVDSSGASDLSGFEFPATDHQEFIQLKKKHPKSPGNLVANEQESNIPPEPKTDLESPPSGLGLGSASSDSHTGALTGGYAARSTSTKKKIIITETRIERRRIDRSDVETKGICMGRSSEARTVEADVKDSADDHSKSEKEDTANGDVDLKEATGATIAISESTVDDSAGGQFDVGAVVKDDQITNTFQQPENDNERDFNERQEEVVKESRVCGDDRDIGKESHVDTCQDTEKQFGGNICDAMMIYSEWLQNPEKTDSEKQISALDFVRKQWFVVCGRKTSSPIDVKTFLSLASSYGEELLQNVVNMADVDGNTALHYAVSYSNTDVINHLLDSGFCDTGHQNKAGYTAIMLAALLLVDMDRHGSIIRRLFESGNVNVPSSLSGQTALMLAASHGRNDTVQLLLTCGASVNAQDEDGSTALMCASEHGHIDIIKTLLSHGDCDSSIADVDGSTALSIAMDEGYQEIGVLLYAHMKALQGSAPGDDDDDDREQIGDQEGPRLSPSNE